MIGRSKRNEMLPDMTSYRMSLDVSVLPNLKKQTNKK
jgi:hypothetical protein